jgi:hypothetical protein
LKLFSETRRHGRPAAAAAQLFAATVAVITNSVLQLAAHDEVKASR